MARVQLHDLVDQAHALFEPYGEQAVRSKLRQNLWPPATVLRPSKASADRIAKLRLPSAKKGNGGGSEREARDCTVFTGSLCSGLNSGATALSP